MEIRGLLIVLTWDVIILNIGLVYYHASKPVGVGYLSYTILEKNLEVFILNPNSGVVSCGLVIRSCWINIDEISSREIKFVCAFNRGCSANFAGKFGLLGLNHFRQYMKVQKLINYDSFVNKCVDLCINTLKSLSCEVYVVKM